MKKHLLNIPFFIVFLFSMTLFSQEKESSDVTNVILPTSIYSFNNTSTYFNNKLSLNNRLNFEQYQFLYLNKQAIEDGYYLIPLNFNGIKPSNLVYETYNDIYHTRILKRSFFKVSELYNNTDARKKVNDFVNKQKQNTDF